MSCSYHQAENKQVADVTVLQRAGPCIYSWRKVNPSNKLSVSDEDRRALFNITVAKELVRPQLERRQIMKNLSRHLKFTINTALHQHPTQVQVGEVSTPDNRNRGQCHLCPRHRDLKTTMRCSMYKSSVCSTHSKNKQTKNKQSVSPVKIKTNFFFQKTKVCLQGIKMSSSFASVISPSFSPHPLPEYDNNQPSFRHHQYSLPSTLSPPSFRHHQYPLP